MSDFDSREFSPKWSYVFMALIAITFFFQIMSDAWHSYTFIPAFALLRPWTFVTSIFLHGGIEHVAFNMIALLFFGPYLERIVGRRRFLMIYFGSGVVGNLGYLVTALEPTIPAIGASGAIYGVMGTIAVLSPMTPVLVYGFIPIPMVLAVVFYGLMDFFGLFAPSGIAHGAHLGGLFLGIAYGLYLRQKYG